MREIRLSEADELFNDAVKVTIEKGFGSIATLQRRLRIGYVRAAKLIETMEEYGIVGKYDGCKPRAVLMTTEEFQNIFKG